MGTGDARAPATRRRRRSWLVALTAVLVVAAVALAGLDLSGRLRGGLVADPRPTPTPSLRLDPRPVSALPVLTPASTAGGPSPGAVPVVALERLLASGPLGASPGALVVDAASGEPLLDREGSRARTPASVLKLTTAAAALTALDPESRLSTRVVQGGDPGDLVLVGGGDATLTRRKTSGLPGRASLATLADRIAEALRAAGVSSVTVNVDDSLFSGPAVSPDWPATYVGSGVVSPVSALSLDGGRVTPRRDARSADPALAAGQELARLLTKRGVPVGGEVTRAVATPAGRELAVVESPTVAELVELMLSTSDNDIAESLLRLAAVAGGRPGTFVDGTAAAAQILAGLGVPVEGLTLLDGSGLARGSTIAPATLAALLVLAAQDTSEPALDHLVTGLPVAGFSGTLATRFGVGRDGAAAGLVLAKTGTLTGVSTLAGVTTAGGRAVVFVVMADRVPGDTLAARAVLDHFAARLVSSGTP